MTRPVAWFVPHVLAAVAAVALGLLAGALLGASWGHAWAGAVVGVLAAAGLMAWRDAARGSRLIEWLRGSLQTEAPRAGGFWGEIGYRMQRALRQREQAIAEQRERLAQFLSGIEASPNGVLLLDAAGRIEWCNAMAAQHFGLDPVRDRQQQVTNLIRAPAFVACLQAASSAAPAAVARPGGGALSVLWRPYGQGQKLVLSQDVTERERADAMRRHFVANVSHEIRTPLTVLSGFLETLADLPLTEPERRRVLLLMQQQTARMQALVSDLLTLAQLEGSPPPPPDRWLTLARLTTAVQTDALALSAGRHSLSFDAPSDVEIAGNEGELLSALGNLLTNAVRYTPEGGRVQARWRWLEDGRGAFEVVDSGIGIAREHLPRLTERFYRVDGSRSRETGGTGLGLAIVKHAVQRHGGEIAIESEPGQGSTFRLVFPAVRLRRSEVGLTRAESAAGVPAN